MASAPLKAPKRKGPPRTMPHGLPDLGNPRHVLHHTIGNSMAFLSRRMFMGAGTAKRPEAGKHFH